MDRLFDIEFEPPIPAPAFIEQTELQDSLAEHSDDLLEATVERLHGRELAVKIAERRNRMRPRRYVKLRCERCPWTTKTTPAETPTACPRCERTGCLVVTGWTSR